MCVSIFPLFLSDFIQISFPPFPAARKIFELCSNFIKICPVGDELFQAGREADGSYSKFIANAPKDDKTFL